MSKPLWFHKTKSNRIILLGPKQEDAAGGCREREGRPCAREDAAEVSRAQIPAFSLTGGCGLGLSCADPGLLAHGRLLPRSLVRRSLPSCSQEAAA